MIRLGLRLTLGGGRESVVRLVVTALAVALGVGLLLIAVAGREALGAQSARANWLNTVPIGSSGQGHPPPGRRSGSGGPSVAADAPNPDPLWWLLITDQFKGQTIDRVDVAATGPRSPVPPGIAHLPGPAQFDASPALSALLHSTPADELGDRFPGKQIGTIGPAALPFPNALIVVVGYSSHQLSHDPPAQEVTSIRTTTTDTVGPGGFTTGGLQAILAIGALALLLPVLVFIGTTTRLAATRREQRFAALRLVGATPRQVSVICAVEASIAALGGVAVGFCLFYLVRPALLHVPFTGEPFAPGDLSLGLTQIVVVAVGVPLAAAAAARVALRRVVITPLGVSRRVTPPAPRATRIIPLLLGVAELAYFVAVGPPTTTGGQIDAFLLGFVLIMGGLVIAGPWLTMVGSRVMSRRTSRASVLIAGRRLSDNPRGAFRAISGLILALFVTSVSFGAITTIVTDHGSLSAGAMASGTLIDALGNPASQQATPSVAAVPGAVLSDLHSIPGVRGVTQILAAPVDTRTDGPVPDTNGMTETGAPVNVVSCAQLATTPALGRCPPGAAVAAVETDLGFVPATKGTSGTARTVWPVADISSARLGRLPVQTVAVATDGSASALARAETVLEVAFPFASSPSIFGALTPKNAATLTELQRMTEVVILASLVIAGCSLAVTMAAGVTDRKRPFSLLRLTGVPVAMLRRVVALETAVPLVVIALASAGTGLLAADLFLRSQLGITLRAPGFAYYLIVLGGLGASLGVIASTLPLLERITRAENARME